MPIMGYFGGSLRKFAGYWVRPIPPEQEGLEEQEGERNGTQSIEPVWRTSSGYKLTWVEAWYSTPPYTASEVTGNGHKEA